MVKRLSRSIYGLLAALGLFSVVVVTTPLVDYTAQPLRLEPQLTPAEAILVLGGGAYQDGTLSSASLLRAVHGFSLFRAGYAPRIVLLGGRARADSGFEALAMKKLLEEVGALPQHLETENLSNRTYTSAVESGRILQAQGVTRILLVTHPNHMLRAKRTFERAGFTIYPAPIPWDRLPTKPKPDLRRIGLLREVVHEYGGLVLYWWRGWL